MLIAPTNPARVFHSAAQSQQAALRGEAEALQRQISTGERLERASDDPVAAARLRAHARADRLAGVEAGNAARAREELGTASARMDELASGLIRARELAVQAANGATSPAGRAAIAQEIGAIRENLFALANSVSATGEPLFAGEGQGPAYSRASDGTVTYTGTSEAGKLEIGPGIAVQRSVAGPSFLSFDHGGAATDVFALLGSLEQGLRANSADAARGALPAFDAALDAVGRGQAVVGTRLSWTETVETIASQTGEARAADAAQAGGADLAASISRLQHIMTTLEASQASYARLASLSLFDQI